MLDQYGQNQRRKEGRKETMKGVNLPHNIDATLKRRIVQLID